MEGKLSEASRWATPSPIQQLSHLAQRADAVNLAKGFPDFPAPAHVKAAATAAIAADLNQYRSASRDFIATGSFTLPSL
jgi:aspartate/methionine/tyrosine aminotransferase